MQLTDSERKELAEIGAKLGKKALAEIATVAQPDTILAWHRKFASQTVTISKPSQSVGRPRVDQEIEALVLRMARENRSWGYDRIQGALKHLGDTISDQTVGNILKRHGILPAPERQKTVIWREFIRSHMAVLWATGFFNSEVWSWFGLAMSFLLSLIHCSCDQAQSVSMMLHQRMRVLKALMRRALDLGLHLRRWAYLVAQRSHVGQDGQAVLEQTRSVLEFTDARQMRPQGMAQVVALSSARWRPIRDGPRRHDQRRHDQQLENYLEAA